MSRKIMFVYGIVSYLAFFLVFLYAIGFVADLIVPKSIDSGTAGALLPSVLIDMLLLGLFAVQHSLMARPAFKRVWTKIVPRPIERTTFVLFASLILALLFWQWRPLPGVIWNVTSGPVFWLLWALFALGWSTVLVSTFMISHADLFGLKQVNDHLHSRPISQPEFKTVGFYQHVRHPIMLGFLIAFWATPYMTLSHLFFATAVTGYILIALQFEEHDLVQRFGDVYRNYRKNVPMLIPGIKLGKKAPQVQPDQQKQPER